MTSKPKLQVLFPMGGLGSRFQSVGIHTPKPLIDVDGKPMILKAVSSFDRAAASWDIQYLFVVRQEHHMQFNLVQKLSEVVPNSKFSLLDHDTKGAVESCLVARLNIDPLVPLVVMDCDLYFQSIAYEQALLTLQKDGFGGLLLYFTSHAPRYSYAAIDEHGCVTKTAEKVPISDHALIGAYGFGSGAIFLRAADQLMSAPLEEHKTKEYYLSLLYNIVLGSGLKVRAVPVDVYESFGTPDELQRYREGKQSHVSE